MKSLKILSVVVISTLLMTSIVPVLGQNKNKTAEVTFLVDLHCMSCKAKIEASIPYEKGVKDLKVDLKEKSVWIKYSPELTNEENLAKALEKLGYSPKKKEDKQV